MSGPRYVCIHGHFYQPPRENPWLEAIEQQETAWPKHDWNERVCDECYAPNSHARILDGNGRIGAITNNYARISFNVGPTLLSWMESAQPDVYAAILEADRESIDRFGGHGSAMAQVYNHMILPLATRRDKVTQVRWGIRDFEARFNRAPEGMWLAETAVDTESLEVLAEHGIKFTVLAPHQCARVKRPGRGFEDVRGQRVDPRRAYLANLPSGRSIALFFYDGPISRAVAFERLLDDGYRFADRLLGGLDEPREEAQFVHIATDGETYGHHHMYGEMALAVALAKIERERGVKLANYGQLLALHPPTWEAQIEEATSWSCVHGVERWRADCGCNSGTGWHQKWRAPLREALDWLRDELMPRFEQHAKQLLRDPWEARDAYIDLVLDRSDAALDAYFARHAQRTLTNAERQRALELLELSRHAMLMYTSCGWFFDEISGIETVQVLRYAARAMQLADGLFDVPLELGFRERLAKAPSNRPELRDGDGVYTAMVEPAKIDLAKVGAHFAIGTVFDDAPKERGRGRDTPPPMRELRVGGLQGHLQEHDLMRTGASRLAIGRLTVQSRITRARGDFSYAVLHFGDHNILGGIREFANAARHVAMHGALSHAFAHADLTEAVRQIERLFDGRTFSLRSLFYDEQAAILERLLAERTRAAEETYRSIYEQTAPLMRFLQSLDQPAPAVFRAAAEYTLMASLKRELEAARRLDLRRVTELLDEARDARVPLDPVVLGLGLQSMLRRVIAEVAREPDELERLLHLEQVAGFVARSPWKMDLGEAQNAIWQLTRLLLPRWRARTVVDDPRSGERVRLLAAVAEHLGLARPV